MLRWETNRGNLMEHGSCVPQGKEIVRTGFHYTLSIIGGKYKMAILYLLAEHIVLRHNAIHRRIEGIPYKTLAAVLKELASNGLVVRTEYPQVPPKVEYALTERGRSLIPILHSMCDWGERHMDDTDHDNDSTKRI